MIYEFKFIENDRKKIIESKTRKNENTRVRNQSGHINTLNNVKKSDNEDTNVSRTTFKRSESNYSL